MVDPLFGLLLVDCWRVIISREAERSSDGCDNIRNLDLDLNNIAVDARCMTQYCTDEKNYKYNDSVANDDMVVVFGCGCFCATGHIKRGERRDVEPDCKTPSLE